MRKPFQVKAGMRVLACLLVLLSGSGLLVGGQMASAGSSGSAVTTVSAAQAQAKIAPRVLQDTQNGGAASFAILMAAQADLSAAYNMRDEDARGWYVYNTLKAHADSTQRDIRAHLDSLGVTYRSYWAANVLYAEGDRALVEALAARSDVRGIESNDPVQAVEPPPVANPQPSGPFAPETVEWNVAAVNAPQVWAMGYTGQGIVIGNQDTGMRWTHAALEPHYRGWNGTSADHNFNWWDAIRTPVVTPGSSSCGYALAQPCDDYGHGTHTTGTTSGDDGQGNQIGVAPGAEWIGCRNMDHGVGRPETYTGCFQFFLAPTDLNGQNADPTKRPDVMNNSWGCPIGAPPGGENCVADSLKTIVENSEAAGIFVVSSAGNSGPNCGTITDPPAIYSATFTTGAIDSNNTLASFSSRGPVTVDGSNRRKPDIVAPGVNVRSSTVVSDTSYGQLSGTSMASPHVVGVVALLWSARPQLRRDIADTKTILQQTANQSVIVASADAAMMCGGTLVTTIPNNYFGYGRVDALAAVNSVPVQTSTPTSTASSTATPACTCTATSTTTSTSTSTRTNTSTATSTSTNTSTATSTATATGTNTATPSSTATSTPTATTSSTATPSRTSTRTPAPSATPTCPCATASPTTCALKFADVPPQDTFYPYVKCLACHGIVSGYKCGGPGEPCNGDNDAYFRPGEFVTRGQTAKIVSLAEGFNDAPGPQIFQDVPPSSTFYLYINGLTKRGIMSGYKCGGPGEPCDVAYPRYFRPGNNATRGQISKIVAGAGFLTGQPSGQTFQDVPPGSTFYTPIEQLAQLDVMQGYSCGSPGEPCIAPENRPYFRPGNTVTRGQAAKITANALLPNCQP